MVTTPLTPEDDDPEPAVPVSAADMATLRSLEALNHTAVMITLHDRRGRALYRNPAASTAVIDPRATVRARFAEPRQFRHLVDAVRRDGRGRLTAAVHTPHGLRWHDISVQRCQDPATGTPACLFSEIDVTELKQVEARARATWRCTTRSPACTTATTSRTACRAASPSGTAPAARPC